jgi:hypothetical protein
MAKRAPAKKAPAKRKPRPKKPLIVPAIEPIAIDDGEWAASAVLRGLLVLVPLVIGIAIGIWSAGGISIGGDVVPVVDAVSEVFDTQEAVFRKLNGELAQKLIAGEVKSENEAKMWMESNFLPQSEAAWIKLLESEKAEFGGDKWTAEKQAAVIGRYAR